MTGRMKGQEGLSMEVDLIGNSKALSRNGIPKKIHYVWMGGAQKDELTLRCIESWKKYMPEYELVEWNESMFDVNAMDYTRDAYAKKKWAFVSDVVRTYALCTCGGVYFDTDVELFSEPGDIFAGGDVVLGFDSRFLLSTGVMASVPEHPVFKELWTQYENAHFTGSFEESTINTRLSFVVMDYIEKRRVTNGEHRIKGIKLLPMKYFSHKASDVERPIFAIHYFAGTWKTKTQLTFGQYVVFQGKRKLLRVGSIVLGNKMHIKLEAAIWHNALRKTAKNLAKGSKIYKVL